MKAIYQDKNGLFPEMRNITPIERNGVRATIPAREALQRAGHQVIVGQEYVDITLDPKASLPDALVAVHVNRAADHGAGFYRDVCLRLEHEPEYPGEYADDSWELAEWMPCPVCGAPLVWYEAGYVPGYRVCGRPPHHHIQVRSNG